MVIVIDKGIQPFVKEFMLAINFDLIKLGFKTKMISTEKLYKFKKDICIYNMNSMSYFRKYGKKGIKTMTSKYYIVIQTEPLGLKNANHLKDKFFLLFINRAVEVWEYGYLNMKKLRNIYPKLNVKFLPFSYSEYYEKQHEKYINLTKKYDVLFLGGPRMKRRLTVKKLNNMPNILFKLETEAYGELKERLIAKSKIILIMFKDEKITVDFLRLAQYASRKAFIIMEKSDDIKTMSVLGDNVITCNYDDIIKTCKIWLNKTQKERDEMAMKTYNFFKNNINYQLYLKKIKLFNDIK